MSVCTYALYVLKNYCYNGHYCDYFNDKEEAIKCYHMKQNSNSRLASETNILLRYTFELVNGLKYPILIPIEKYNYNWKTDQWEFVKIKKDYRKYLKEGEYHGKYE